MRWWSALAVLMLSACAHATPVHPTASRAGVASCDGSDLALRRGQPVTVLVHGMHSSGDGFARLAEVFRADGQQVVCFRYDPRASLLESAQQLRAAVVQLESSLHSSEIVLLGHSQGGLVARAALARSAQKLPAQGQYRLVTVASPFAGIRVARHCGSIPYHLVSFGVSYAVCRAISGDSWNQIHPGAQMVREPAELDDAVREHLLLVTDERDTCRRFSADGLRCLQDDYVFSEREQHNARIERDRRVVAAPIAQGHVQVVGAQGPPRKLIEALQQHGLLSAEAPGRVLLEEQSAKRGW